MRTNDTTKVAQASSLLPKGNASWKLALPCALMLCAMVAILLPRAEAANCTWIVSSGSWNEPANWSGGVVPSTIFDQVFIDNGGSAFVPLGVSGTTDSVIVGNTASGSLSMTGGYLKSGNVLLGYAVNSSGTTAISSGTWNHSNFYIGYQGTGSLSISGGNISSFFSYLGYAAGSQGTATISSGTWNTTNDLEVGFFGSGSLTISGGSVSSSNTRIGHNAGSIGNLAISSGTLISTSGIGVDTGTFNMTGGSVVAGVGGVENGVATISGGTWSSSTFILAGGGTGSLTVSGGSFTTTFFEDLVGKFPGSLGSVVVAGGTYSNFGGMVVGYEGIGSVTISSGMVSIGSGTGTMTLARLAGSSGTLNLGTGSTAGILNAAVVSGSAGTATVNFNHTGSVTFAPRLTGTMSVNKLATGTTILTGSNNYVGPTTVSAGTLVINGNQSAVTGTTNVLSAATLSGSGTIGGAVNVSGTLAPGGSPGLLTMNNALTLTGSATALMELSGTARGTSYDAVNIAGQLAMNGALQIVFFGGFVPVMGDSFDLFNWGSVTGNFTSFNLPSLTGGLNWNTSSLNTTGVISVVPEPGTATFLLLGAAGILLKRGRR